MNQSFGPRRKHRLKPIHRNYKGSCSGRSFCRSLRQKQRPKQDYFDLWLRDPPSSRNLQLPVDCDGHCGVDGAGHEGVGGGQEVRRHVGKHGHGVAGRERERGDAGNESHTVFFIRDGL